mgnify:FL=1
MSFFVGLIMLVLGSVVTIKSEKVLEMFGRSEFFEDKLATAGGSRLGYKLTGLIIAFLGILTMTGLIGGFLEFVLSPILKYSRIQ